MAVSFKIAVARFDVDNRRGRLDGYLRVVLVHHHQYPYPTDSEKPKHIPRLIIDIVAPDEDGFPQPITTVGCGGSLGAGGRDLSFNIVEWRLEHRSSSVDFRIDPQDGAGFRSVAMSAQSLPEEFGER